MLARVGKIAVCLECMFGRPSERSVYLSTHARPRVLREGRDNANIRTRARTGRRAVARPSKWTEDSPSGSSPSMLASLPVISSRLRLSSSRRSPRVIVSGSGKSCEASSRERSDGVRRMLPDR